MPTPYSIYNTRSLTDANAPTLFVANVTGAQTVYSDVFSGESSDGFSLSVFTTGTLTGTFTLWFTDNMFPDLTTDNDWIQDTSFSPTNPAGSAVKFFDEAGNAKAFRKRLKFVSASGTGTLKATVTVPVFIG